MTYPLVRDLAVDGIPVTVTCRVLKFSTQAFYAWCADPVSERDLVDAYAMNAAFEVHRDDPGFGYRFIADELAAAGHEISERRVWKICSQAQIVSAHARTRGRWKKPGPPVHDDLIKRDFTADDVNEIWLTDITEHWTDEGKLYLCAIKDVFSGRIVGYSISDRMKVRLVMNTQRHIPPWRCCCVYRTFGPREPGWIQLVDATPQVEEGVDGTTSWMAEGWIQSVDATPSCSSDCSCSANTSAGDFQSRTFRGRLLTASATASRSCAVQRERSVPFGKY